MMLLRKGFYVKNFLLIHNLQISATLSFSKVMDCFPDLIPTGISNNKLIAYPLMVSIDNAIDSVFKVSHSRLKI